MPSLPEEIQEEITLRLPVESILRCKSVCKFWRDIISCPKFIKNNLNLNIQNNNIDPSIIYTGFYFDFIKYPITLRYNVGYAPFFGMDENGYARIEILGSCNGLICLRITGVDRYMFYVWNPSTGEYKKIPGRKLHAFHVLSTLEWHPFSYGFGYDCVRDDYKLVRIGAQKIQVYTLGSDSWSNTRSTPYPDKGNQVNISGVTFNGALHWLCASKETCIIEVIVSFNISSEIISDMPLGPLPIEPMPLLVSRAGGLGVLRDCLCLYVALRNDDCEIWVMQDYGVRESWTKMFTVTSESCMYNHLCRWPQWAFQNGEILTMEPNDVVLSDLKKGRGLMTFDVCGVTMAMSEPKFVESLVSLNSGTYCVWNKNK